MTIVQIKRQLGQPAGLLIFCNRPRTSVCICMLGLNVVKGNNYTAFSHNREIILYRGRVFHSCE